MEIQWNQGYASYDLTVCTSCLACVHHESGLQFLPLHYVHAPPSLAGDDLDFAAGGDADDGDADDTPTAAAVKPEPRTAHSPAPGAPLPTPGAAAALEGGSAAAARTPPPAVGPAHSAASASAAGAAPLPHAALPAVGTPADEGRCASGWDAMYQQQQLQQQDGTASPVPCLNPDAGAGGCTPMDGQAGDALVTPPASPLQQVREGVREWCVWAHIYGQCLDTGMRG